MSAKETLRDFQKENLDWDKSLCDLVLDNTVSQTLTEPPVGARLTTGHANAKGNGNGESSTIPSKNAGKRKK